MPRSEEISRGGTVRYRTKCVHGKTRPHGTCKGGKYLTVSVVRKPGPRGGRTVAGPVKRS